MRIYTQGRFSLFPAPPRSVTAAQADMVKRVRQRHAQGKNHERHQRLLLSHGPKAYGIPIITPHAIRFPAFPVGSVFMSSPFSCTMIDVPPLAIMSFAVPVPIDR